MFAEFLREYSAGRTPKPERPVDAAEATAVQEGSAALGIIGAAGAMGGFLIPITFGNPWVTDPVSAMWAASGMWYQSESPP